MDEEEVRKKMSAVLELLTSDLASIRTGRASPSLIEGLQVVVYGGSQKLKINELATISVSDNQTIIIDPWDKSIIGEIRKGIEASNVGYTPVIDGDKIRIVLPPMTTEDRQKYIKLLKVKVESGKVMIRQIRAGFMKNIKSSFEEKEISEDEKFSLEKKLQEITDDFIERIDLLSRAKEEEIMRI